MITQKMYDTALRVLQFVQEAPDPPKVARVLSTLTAEGFSTSTVQGAMDLLKSHGLLHPSKHRWGYLVVTEAGKTATEIPGRPNGEGETPTAEKTETPKKGKVVETVTAAEPVVPVVPPESWIRDEALKTLVIANRPCYASWRPGHPACGACPIATDCRGALSRTLQLVARRIEVNAGADPDGADASLLSAVSTATRPAATRKPGSLPVIGSILVQGEARDFQTKESIAPGSSALYVHGLGFTVHPYEPPKADPDPTPTAA